tara:strand:+ start:213 stop:494 length:282 start_codon:yes stop_codon:yes gene_type:complete
MEDFNRNEKQQFFSTIKGVLKEIQPGDKFSSITIEVGHERPRLVNLVIKNILFEKVKQDLILENKLSIAYYITSRKFLDKWTTMANVLTVKLS